MSNKQQASSFHLSMEDVMKFSSNQSMLDQIGVEIAFLSDPEVIADVLPPQLKPMEQPVVIVTATHIRKPGFSEDYYESIIKIPCLYGDLPGIYMPALILGGPGQEMAMHLGRGFSGMSKKCGAQFNMRRNGDRVYVDVSRRGSKLIEASLKIGEFNTPAAAEVFGAPKAGDTLPSNFFLYTFDRIHNDDGSLDMSHGRLLNTSLVTNYHSYEPATAELKLLSGIDDPWGEFPVKSVLGAGVYVDDFLPVGNQKLQDVNAMEVLPYLLTGLFDRSVFGEVGNI